MKRSIDIITDSEGKKIVVINDVRFKGKTKEEWEEVENYLKEYIGEFYEIAETSEKIYIGKDFPDEFTHGKDKTVLKGPNAKAKANASLVVGELIQFAQNKSIAPDYNRKHKNRAQHGWYRHDIDGKIYLYDFLRTKKETSSPL